MMYIHILIEASSSKPHRETTAYSFLCVTMAVTEIAGASSKSNTEGWHLDLVQGPVVWYSMKS